MKVIENVSAPKRKRYNKNKKKAWRKKVQIKEIEEFLEDQRREERYGGPLEEKQDNELMFLDTGTEADSGEKKVQPVTFAVDTRRGHNEGFKASTRKNPVKVLQSHRFLNGLQGAKTPHKEKTKEDKVKAVTNAQDRKTEVLMKKPHLVKRSRAQVRQIRAGKKPLKAKVANRMEVNWTTDAWDANSNKLVKDCEENDVDESFADGIVKYYSITTKTHRGKVPEWRYKQTSALPSVAPPDPGQSYNPTFEDHQNLMCRAVKQQLKIHQEEGKYKGLTTAMFPTIDEAPTEETWLAEMSEGLPTAGNASEEEIEGESDKEENEATVSGKKTTEKKTKKQRKKERKQKYLKRRTERMKVKRVRESNVFRVKTYKKEIKETEELLKTRHISRQAHLELKKSKPRRLGKLKYQPETIAVSLGSELSGTLRTAKPAVSLMDERFKNFQRRNLLEPRLPVKARNKKPKTTMKKDHRKTLMEIEKMAQE